MAIKLMGVQVTVENVSSGVVPEDVELRLISQSRGVSKATQTMHKYSSLSIASIQHSLRTCAQLQFLTRDRAPRTKKPMQPKETFTCVM